MASHPSQVVDRSTIEFLVSSAVKAISGDNSQPWHFSWDGRTLTISVDVSRAKFPLDACGESGLLAVGAAFENLRLAASTRDIHAEAEVVDARTIRVKLRNGALTPEPLSEAVDGRCVNRNFYDRRPVTNEAKEAITSLRLAPSLSLHWIDRGESFAAIADLVAACDRFVFSEQSMYDVLMRWVRFSQDAPDGMPLATLGLNAVERLTFPMLKKRSFVTTFGPLGLFRSFADRTKRLVNSSGALCLLTVDAAHAAKAQSYFDAGSAFQRIWLQAHACGVSVQPMSAAVFIASKFLADGLSGYPVELQRMGERAVATFRTVADENVPAMLLRLGYANPPAARTNRRALEEVLRFTGDS